ncbi:hypothetical protein CROQUDRAFT_135457 [Cronartium quercuum f. sp. fusiforme G11]|uniref:Uncharacterized protein n=1 Tax=Cronartium quercuum f. sp. fusiforme G11 TaxID=708437 RepID=A0A9P6NBL0_9BASI|nr:hypothetical protein CROQUDRAFT_135457 [Cronartium quercuum f. sp. fusiforme G11]
MASCVNCRRSDVVGQAGKKLWTCVMEMGSTCEIDWVREGNTRNAVQRCRDGVGVEIQVIVKNREKAVSNLVMRKDVQRWKDGVGVGRQVIVKNREKAVSNLVMRIDVQRCRDGVGVGRQVIVKNREKAVSNLVMRIDVQRCRDGVGVGRQVIVKNREKAVPNLVMRKDVQRWKDGVGVGRQVIVKNREKAVSNLVMRIDVQRCRDGVGVGRQVIVKNREKAVPNLVMRKDVQRWKDGVGIGRQGINVASSIVNLKHLKSGLKDGVQGIAVPSSRMTTQFTGGFTDCVIITRKIWARRNLPRTGSYIRLAEEMGAEEAKQTAVRAHALAQTVLADKRLGLDTTSADVRKVGPVRLCLSYQLKRWKQDCSDVEKQAQNLHAS